MEEGDKRAARGLPHHEPLSTVGGQAEASGEDAGSAGITFHGTRIPHHSAGLFSPA